MPRSQPPPARARRSFIKAVGLAGLSSALAPPLLALAQSAPPPGKGDAAPAKPDSASTPALPPEISEDARALAEIVRRRFGKHLTPEQLEDVARELDSRVRGGQTLRKTTLANSDEPDVTFRP